MFKLDTAWQGHYIRIKIELAIQSKFKLDLLEELKL